MQISLGSASELQYQALPAHNSGYQETRSTINYLSAPAKPKGRWRLFSGHSE
jgi:hypothetical protein